MLGFTHKNVLCTYVIIMLLDLCSVLFYVKLMLTFLAHHINILWCVHCCKPGTLFMLTFLAHYNHVDIFSWHCVLLTFLAHYVILTFLVHCVILIILVHCIVLPFVIHYDILTFLVHCVIWTFLAHCVRLTFLIHWNLDDIIELVHVCVNVLSFVSERLAFFHRVSQYVLGKVGVGYILQLDFLQNHK